MKDHPSPAMAAPTEIHPDPTPPAPGRPLSGLDADSFGLPPERLLQFILRSLNRIDDEIFWIDREGRILDANETAYRNLGYRREELLRLCVGDVDPKYKAARWPDYWQALKARGSLTFESQHLTRAGSIFPIEVVANHVEFDGREFNCSLVRDISQRKETEAALRSREEQLRMVLEAAELGLWDWDIVLDRVDRNERWAEMLGYRLSELDSKVLDGLTLVHPDDRERVWRSLNETQAGRLEKHRMEYRMLHRDGSYRWIFDHGRVTARDAAGCPIRMSGIHVDITERKHLEVELQRQAHTDFLTGLPNRRHFMQIAEHELNRSIRYGGQLAILMLDVDHFKAINDRHGHKFGDTVLVRLAEVFRGILRTSDVAGRMGGEEFAILLPETPLEGAAEVAERLRQAVADTEVPLPGALPFRFTASLGIAMLDARDHTLDQLLNLADKGLYQAKASGRNRVCLAEA
ncbi:MAG: diguanylate cyclase [Azonexus sp.]|nr:sensor domain-containing diguanylate cyclase [Azonexus sp.]MCK6413837.1 diguanylate cyclase [Azonexus sp.]